MTGQNQPDNGGDYMSRVRLPRGFSKRGKQIASLATILAVCVSVPANAQDGPALVGVAKTEQRLFTETAPILGRMVAPTQADIATRVAGIVDSVFVAVGDRVAIGDPVAKLNSEFLEIQKDAAKASQAQAIAAIKVAIANLEMAKQSFARMQNLKSSVAFSRARFEDLQRGAEAAKGSLAETEARMANATADLAEATYNIRNTEVRTAVGGIVIARDTQPGEYLQVGSTIVTILDDAHLEIETDVPTEIVGSVTPGQVLDVTLDDGSMHKARVRALIPSESLSTRTRPVRLKPDFFKLAKPLASGQSATIHVPVAAGRSILTVPKDALVQSRGGWIVYVAIDGKAQPRTVTIGSAFADRFEVLSGLEPDMLVVIRGNERLRPGQDIRFEASPTNEKTTSPAAANKTSGVRATGKTGG